MNIKKNMKAYALVYIRTLKILKVILSVLTKYDNFFLYRIFLSLYFEK